MFDAALRGWIDAPLNAIGRSMASRGVSADQVTLSGFAVGISAAIAVGFGFFLAGLFLIVLNRICDGIDGAVARVNGATDRGGFLDIALDFVFYSAIPLAFAFGDPGANALSAAVLLAAFLANGTAFLAYAVIAEKRRMTTAKQGQKSIYYLAGLAEGGETIAAFCAFCLWPTAFPILALAFAAVCAVSAVGRLAAGWVVFD